MYARHAETSPHHPHPIVLPSIDYPAVVRSLSYKKRGIFERLRDLFDTAHELEMSLNTLAHKIDCSRTLLVELLREFEQLGLLRVFRKRASAKRCEVNRYQLPDALRHHPVHPTDSLHPLVRVADSISHDRVHLMDSIQHQVHLTDSFPNDRVHRAHPSFPSTARTERESEEKEAAEEDTSSSSLQRHIVNSPSNSQNTLKLKLLSEAGVHPRNHKKLLDYPLEDLQRAIELAQRRADTSFDGYIVTVLRQGFFDEREKLSSMNDIPQPETQPSAPAHAQQSNAVAPSQGLEADSAAPAPTPPPIPHYPQLQPQAQPSAHAHAQESHTVTPSQGLKADSVALTQAQPQAQPVNEAPPLRVVAHDEVQQPQATPQADSAPQPAQNLDDPDGQKAALFESVGLKPHHYADCIVYSLYAIHSAIQTACHRQAKHVGHYALAILRKQPSLLHDPQPQPQPQPTLASYPIDYSQFVNRWDLWEEQKAQQPPHDPNHDIWMSFGKNALASMGQKHHWLTIQHAYVGFDLDSKTLLLKHDQLPQSHEDIFVQRFVERLEMIPWNYQEVDPTKRFHIKVKLI